jgi:hypothetical protein
MGRDRKARAKMKLAAQLILGVERSLDSGERILNFGRETRTRDRVSSV